MNILLIITPFNPAQTPNTIRWNALISQFVKNGYNVTVLTTIWAGQEIFEKKSGVRIFRTGHNTLLDFLYNKLGINKRRNISRSATVDRPGFIISSIEKLVNQFWRKRYWPDGSVLFLKPGKKLVTNIIKEHSVSHVISVGLPFTNHLIAKEAKSKFPNVHWTMDVQDPFSISDSFWVNNFSKYAMKNISAEEECLALADKVVFTNSKVVELYEELFVEHSKKYREIPPVLVLPDKVKQSKNDLELDESKIHLAYFGSFYNGVRSPFRFLKFLDYLFKNYKASVSKMQFHFYGELNKFSKPIFVMFDHLSPSIKHHGFVKHTLLQNHIEKYDLLLNFGNTTNYHLPSKVVELLYWHKPTINITSINDDSAKLFLEDKLDFFNLNLNVEMNEALAEDFVDYVFRNHNIQAVSKELIADFLPEQVARSYINVMKSD